MNIKQAEQLSGVSRRNIRYYEQEGLITPSRNQENDYREYSQEDIEVLKRIRILRMVDMPLEQIASLLEGALPLNQAINPGMMHIHITKSIGSVVKYSPGKINHAKREHYKQQTILQPMLFIKISKASPHFSNCGTCLVLLLHQKVFRTKSTVNQIS